MENAHKIQQQEVEKIKEMWMKIVLLEEFDLNRNAVINPDMCVDKIEDFPDVTISCFSEQLFNKVLAFFDAKEISAVHSACGTNPVYEIDYKEKNLRCLSQWLVNLYVLYNMKI